MLISMFFSDLIKNRPCFSLINFKNNVTAHQFILFFSMTNTAKKNSPTSPGKAISLVKASTPPKKLKTNRSPLKSMKSARDQQIRYKEVGIEGVCLAFAFKPDGVHPSFMGPLIRALDEDEDQKSAGNILFLTQARHSNGSNTIAQTPSMTGKMYPTDVIVMSIDDENKTFVSAVDDLIKVLHNVATSDNCRGSWQFSIPTFVNKGSATPPSVPAMSTYLLNEDCITFIKRFYEHSDTKEQLCNNEYRDDILEAVFGEADKGWTILEAMADDEYDLL
jgi:hypothetical protein